jgi:hypothetical protein
MKAIFSLYLSMQVFLIKHLRNVKTADDDFILDFEEIYVIDSATKSIKRADVKVNRIPLLEISGSRGAVGFLDLIGLFSRFPYFCRLQ